MKKTIIGVIISSIILIAFAIFLQSYIENSSDKLTKRIELIKMFVLTDEIDLARKNNILLKDEWHSEKKKWEMIIDHEEIDNIEERMLEVEMLIEENGDKAELMSSIEVLKFFVEHIPEKEKLSLNNLL